MPFTRINDPLKASFERAHPFEKRPSLRGTVSVYRVSGVEWGGKDGAGDPIIARLKKATAQVRRQGYIPASHAVLRSTQKSLAKALDLARAVN